VWYVDGSSANDDEQVRQSDMLVRARYDSLRLIRPGEEAARWSEIAGHVLDG